MKKTIGTSLLAAGLMASAASAATIQVDLGINGVQNTTVTGWNNMSGPAASGNPGNIANAVDSTGAATGISMTYSESGVAGTPGTGANYTGSAPVGLITVPSPVPGTAIMDGTFARSGAWFDITIAGLDTNLTYDFQLWGARGLSDETIKDVFYQVNGLTTGIPVNVGTSYNNQTMANIEGVSPTAGGVIVVHTSVESGNTQGGSLNLFTMTSVPEPSSAALFGLGGIALLIRRRK